MTEGIQRFKSLATELAESWQTMHTTTTKTTTITTVRDGGDEIRLVRCWQYGRGYIGGDVM